MSFERPWLLLGLALLPVAVWIYADLQRRRERAAEAFATRPLLASVAPVRPGRRRHAAMAAYGLALAALVVALARPQTTVAVPVEQASIVLATDVSGSMTATDVQPTRIAAVREAARRFVEEVPSGVNIGLIAFNQRARVLQAPTKDRQVVLTSIARLTPSGGTAMGDALASALRLLDRRPRLGGRRAPAAIVLLSDGASVRGADPVQVAGQVGEARVPVYTVGLGTADGTITVRTPSGGTQVRRVPPDTRTLERVAAATRGRAFSAADADELSAVYRNLGSKLTHRNEPREVTAAFAGGALALLAAGGLMSLRWFGRFP